MTAALKREISRADILPMADYARERKALRESVVAVKKHRRVAVGEEFTEFDVARRLTEEQVPTMAVHGGEPWKGRRGSNLVSTAFEPGKV